MNTYEAYQIKEVKVQVSGNKSRGILEKIKTESLGIYRFHFQEMNPENNKIILRIEFPIWARDEIISKNLEELHKILSKNDCELKILDNNPHLHLEKKLVIAENYPYKEIAKKILLQNQWAQKEVLGRQTKSVQ